MMFKWLKK